MEGGNQKRARQRTAATAAFHACPPPPRCARHLPRRGTISIRFTAQEFADWELDDSIRRRRNPVALKARPNHSSGALWFGLKSRDLTGRHSLGVAFRRSSIDYRMVNQLNYIAIFNVRGISMLPDSKPLRVWKHGKDTAYLTKNLAPFADPVDRGTAIAHGLLTALFNGTEDQIRDRISDRILEIRADREKKYQSGTFLVFHGITEIPELKLEFHRERPDFNVAFDAFDKSEMREKFKPVVVRSLAAITLSLKDRADPRIAKVTDGMYVLHPDSEKPTYSFTFTSGNLRVSIGTMLDDDAENRINHYAENLRKDRHIGKVLDQLVESLAKEKDEFRAFLAAWTALEIFVTSTFKRTYEKFWFDKLRGAAPSSAQSYFKSVQGIMNQRHRLLDKFLIMACLLDPESADQDIEKFKDLKKIRDNVFHGSDDANANYPTDQTHDLLTKYLRLHYGIPGTEFREFRVQMVSQVVV